LKNEWEIRESVGLPWLKVSENRERDAGFEEDSWRFSELGEKVSDWVCLLLWEKLAAANWVKISGGELSERTSGGLFVWWGEKRDTNDASQNSHAWVKVLGQIKDNIFFKKCYVNIVTDYYRRKIWITHGLFNLS